MSDMNSLHNLGVWFDIPVVDLDRASTFYRSVLGLPVHRQESDGFVFAVLSHDQGNGGCLVPAKTADVHSEGGILVYLNVDGRIRDAVSQVEKVGGTVIEPVHAIGPHGFRTLILDSEGNRLALHSSVDA
jgi:uncharacterized protein